MNKKGKKMNVIVKVLFLVAVLITVFSGINSLMISAGRESLVRAVTANNALPMQILYILIGISSLVTSVVLALKIIKK